MPLAWLQEDLVAMPLENSIAEVLKQKARVQILVEEKLLGMKR